MKIVEKTETKDVTVEAVASQKPIKVDAKLWAELDRWLNTEQAKKVGFHSKAQFATEAIREKLEQFQPRISISESNFDEFQRVYENNKKDLSKKGIKNFSDYVTYMLEEMMQKDKTFARYSPKIEKISVDDDRVILKDNVKNRIAEIAIANGELFCQLCDERDCVHVGFVFSLPDVYEVINSKGIKAQTSKELKMSELKDLKSKK